MDVLQQFAVLVLVVLDVWSNSLVDSFFHDGWLTSGENRGIGENVVEMEGNLIAFGDHMDQPSHSMNVEKVQSTEVSQPVNLTLKNKRSTVKKKRLPFILKVWQLW